MENKIFQLKARIDSFEESKGAKKTAPKIEKYSNNNIKNEKNSIDDFLGIVELPTSDVDDDRPRINFGQFATDDINDENLCMICCKNERNCAFITCGHYPVCVICSDNLNLDITNKKTKKKQSLNINNTGIIFKGRYKCPMCNMESQELLKLYK